MTSSSRWRPSVAVVSLLLLLVPAEAARAQGRLRGRCTFTRTIRRGEPSFVNNYDPHFCGPLTTLLYGTAYTRESGSASCGVARAHVRTKDLCVAGAQIGEVSLGNACSLELRLVRGCDAPHPEFFDEYTSLAKGSASLESAPGNAAAGVSFKIKTTLIEDEYDDGAARTSSAGQIPVGVKIPGGLEASGGIPVARGEGSDPFSASGVDASVLTHVPGVRATIVVTAYATATSDSGIVDGYAKANAKGTIYATDYRIEGFCGNCLARDTLVLRARSDEQP